MARPLPLIALLATLAAAHADALAQLALRTSASNLRYTLDALDGAGGAAPAVRFGAMSASQLLVASLQAYHAEGDDYVANLNRDGFDASTLENRWGEASIASRFDAGAGPLDWEGSVTVLAPRIQNQSFYMSGRNHSPIQTFELAPHTSMTLYLDAQTALSTGRDVLSYQYGNGGTALFGSLAGAGQELRDVMGGGVGSGYPTLQATVEDTLSITFSNDGDAWLAGSFGWRIDSTANLYVHTPIPEPGAWAMYLAGAGLLAGAARRRRARGATSL